MIISNLKAFNRPSDALQDVPEDWADAIVTSPPYNLGHGAPDSSDMVTHAEYCRMMRTVLQGCFRAMKPSGILTIDVADWIETRSGKRFPLASFIDKSCRESGLHFVQRISYLALEADCADAGHDRGHSERQNILVFSRAASRRGYPSRMQPFYLFGKDEPEVFWPPTYVRDLFRTLDLAGKALVEPFAGSAKLVRLVIDSGGSAIAYEISTQRFMSFLAPMVAGCSASAV